MHWLTKYTNKECNTCSDMHALYNMTTLFNNHPYRSSSKFSANRHATATYVGVWLVDVGKIWLFLNTPNPTCTLPPYFIFTSSSLHFLNFFHLICLYKLIGLAQVGISFWCIQAVGHVTRASQQHHLVSCRLIQTNHLTLIMLVFWLHQGLSL